MDIKNYIGSGILEDYVLGMVSDQERREVQCLSKIYPEIAAYVAEIEDELAGAVLHEAVTPPENLKSRILENLPERDEDDSEVEEPRVVHLPPPVVETEVVHKTSNGTTWRMVAAVAVIVGLGGLYVNSTYQSNALEEELLQSQSQNALVQEQLNSTIASVERLSNDMAMLTNPSTTKIALSGTDNAPEAQVLVYWNPDEQTVLLDPGSLPPAPEGKQYQLWTLVGGQPIDQGLLSLEEVSGLQQMKPANAADAFAITLEDVGGRPEPTLEQLMVVGAVES